MIKVGVVLLVLSLVAMGWGGYYAVSKGRGLAENAERLAEKSDYPLQLDQVNRVQMPLTAGKTYTIYVAAKQVRGDSDDRPSLPMKVYDVQGQLLADSAKDTGGFPMTQFQGRAMIGHVQVTAPPSGEVVVEVDTRPLFGFDDPTLVALPADMMKGLVKGAGTMGAACCFGLVLAVVGVVLLIVGLVRRSRQENSAVMPPTAPPPPPPPSA